MPDDSRHRFESYADGLESGRARLAGVDCSAGHAIANQPLTVETLDRHMKLHPPDSRDTVAGYLRGLQNNVGTRIGTTDAQEQATHDTSRNHNEHSIANDPYPTEHYNGAEMAIALQEIDGGYFNASEEILPPKPAAPSVSRTKLVETRRPSVASMKSNQDSPARTIPASHASTRSSTFELLRPVKSIKKGQRGRIAAPDIACMGEAGENKPSDRSKCKRKLSEACSGGTSGRLPRNEVAQKPVSPSRAKYMEDVAGKEDTEARRTLLDQRKERRRAKAVIVKDRSKVTAPSDAILKANRKAHQESTIRGASKYRQADEAEDRGRDKDRRKREKEGHRASRSSTVDSLQGESREQFRYQVSRKKRSSDVQRNVAALKQASMGKHQGSKKRRHDPLERAANILPAGRVTLKARTGIYNHGQASSKHAVGQNSAPKKLTDLAFNELPFLNQPVTKSSRLKPLQGKKPYREQTATRRVTQHTRCFPQSTSSVSQSSGIGAQVPKTIARHRLRQSKLTSRFTSPRESKSEAAVGYKESGRARSPQPQSAVTPSRAQGLALKALDVSSAWRPSEVSVQATVNATPVGSRMVSTIAESGQQLSSLTGLSAGSLARRRLLRRMDETAQVLQPRMNGNDLQSELRMFRGLYDTAAQDHGPFTKHGPAHIPQGRPRAAPDVLQVSHKAIAPSTPAPCQSYAFPGLHPVNRSPDWFADSEAQCSDIRIHRYGEHATPPYQTSTGNIMAMETNLHGQDTCHSAHRASVVPDNDFPVGAGSHTLIPQYTHVIEPKHQYATSASSSRYDHREPLQPMGHRLDASDDPTLQAIEGANYCSRPNIPTSEYHWELVELGSPWQATPQSDPVSLHTYVHVDVCEPGRTLSHELPPSIPYMEEAAPFQRGRADLYGYFPQRSSPPQSLPLTGFWQRNYL